MPVPPKSDERWRVLLTGDGEPRFSSLATRLLVARLRHEVKRNPEALSSATDELHAFFSSNAFVARDLSAF